MSRLEACLSVLVAAAGSACDRGTVSSPAAADPLNVIIIVVDTLPADHMSMLGYERSTTPFIDQFASSAVVF